MNFVPRTIPPYRARAPSAPVLPAAIAPDPDHEYEFDEEDLDALEFEAAVMARASAPEPISIPTSELRRSTWRPALPVQALGALDAHYWQRQPGVLAHWARGAGLGAAANSVTDAMFTPGSPPRTTAVHVSQPLLYTPSPPSSSGHSSRR